MRLMQMLDLNESTVEMLQDVDSMVVKILEIQKTETLSDQMKQQRFALEKADFYLRIISKQVCELRLLVQAEIIQAANLLRPKN